MFFQQGKKYMYQIWEAINSIISTNYATRKNSEKLNAS